MEPQLDYLQAKLCKICVVTDIVHHLTILLHDSDSKQVAQNIKLKTMLFQMIHQPWKQNDSEVHFDNNSINMCYRTITAYHCNNLSSCANMKKNAGLIVQWLCICICSHCPQHFHCQWAKLTFVTQPIFLSNISSPFNFTAPPSIPIIMPTLLVQHLLLSPMSNIQNFLLKY